MSDSTRREFLRRTAGAVAASSVIGANSSSSRATEADRPASVAIETIPPHRSMPLEGVHAYTDEVSVAAGQPIRFHVSSTLPYQLEVCRLGLDVDTPDGDEVLHTWEVDTPQMQPIHPGSYIHVENGLDATQPLAALTVELWVRLWRTSGRQCLVSQYDEPDAGGFALFVTEGGSLGYYLGDHDSHGETNLHWTEPAVLTRSTTTGKGRAAVIPGRWHHVVATFDGRKKSLFVDGKKTAEWDGPAVTRPGKAPLRIGASGKDGQADELLDGDIAMPALYAKALSEREVKVRFDSKAAKPPADDKLLACWPLAEERGTRVADASGHKRDGRIVNHATWMIGGPAFNAAIPRYTEYDPAKDASRGHGLRLASDDLMDCRWQPTHEFTVPTDARSGLYVGRIRYQHEGEDRLYHATFIVRPAGEKPKSPIALLFSTNTWKAYDSTPFCPGWSGLEQSIGTLGYNVPMGDAKASFSCYREHRGGQPTAHIGWRMPWPVIGPFVGYMAKEEHYSHQSTADRWTQTWLEREGYLYDAYSQLDLARDPHLLDGHRVLAFAGHSEYWSAEEMATVERFLAAGGCVVNLSGNTMYWRVSHDHDARSMECRKIDAWGEMIRPEFRGEGWHSADHRVGGVLRDAGSPPCNLIGTDFISHNAMTQIGVSPFQVAKPDHFLFAGPHKVEVKEGDPLAVDPAPPHRHAIGHESDVRVSTLMGISVEKPPAGAPQGLVDPPGIEVLAVAKIKPGTTKNDSMRDYYHRVVQVDEAHPSQIACEMIYWQRPDGGRVFAAPTIAAGRPLSSDVRWSNLLKNVLHHFGAEPKATS